MRSNHEDDEGVRPVRTAILSMGRKNGKTALAALLALCHTVGPEAEPRGEAYSCANDRQQASKIFAEAEASILQHPLLADRVIIYAAMKMMKDMVTGVGLHRAVARGEDQDGWSAPRK